MRFQIKPIDRREAALIGANLLVLALLMITIGSGNKSRAILAVAATKVPSLAELPAPPSADTLDLQAIRELALFHASRHFFSVDDAATGPAVAPPDYKLVGTMMGSQNTAVAFLLSNRDGGRRKIAVGDDLEGWTVADITNKSVTLKKGDATAEITTNTQAAATTGVSVSAASTGGYGGRPPGITVVHAAVSPNSEPKAVSMPKVVPVDEGAARLYRPPPGG